MKYCDMYCWGGRREQELVAQMRQRGEADRGIITTDSDVESGMENWKE